MEAAPFFMGNFSRQEEKKKKIYTQHCIFSRGYLPVKMTSKTVITVRFDLQPSFQ